MRVGQKVTKKFQMRCASLGIQQMWWKLFWLDEIKTESVGHHLKLLRKLKTVTARHAEATGSGA